jgi:hypothetical protein
MAKPQLIMSLLFIRGKVHGFMPNIFVPREFWEVMHTT